MVKFRISVWSWMRVWRELGFNLLGLVLLISIFEVIFYMDSSYY